MKRRSFLQLAALVGCSPRHVASPAMGIRAVAFDLFTIFDARTVDRRLAEAIGDKATTFASTWKTRLFEYSWICASADHYVAFETLVDHSLVYATRVHDVELDAVAHLARIFTELEPWPDARATLQMLRDRGLRLAPLANFGSSMIEALLDHAVLRDLFELQISTDAVRSYKPHPRAYALAESRFGLRRGEIAFAAFGGWDANGAAWFGFPTFWVNRLGLPADELVAPDASGPDLVHFASWLARHDHDP